MIAAQRSPTSGRRAMTTRFITLVRAATRRSSFTPSRFASIWRFVSAQMRASSPSTSSMLWARDRQRRTGSFGRAGACGAMTPPLPSVMSDPPPLPALAGEQLVGRRGAPGAGVVVREVRLRVLGPLVDDRRHPGPGALDLVGPREQRGVAEQR